ncbi:MAG: flagellar biosynthesis protein FlhA [Proteobacteria bacterium]|nr:flagellar biosynthesis protein FlhA [Pseudomonadota bacterium]
MLYRVKGVFSENNWISRVWDARKYSGILFAIGILCIVGFLIFPVPPIVLDFLLSLSLAISVLILMATLFIDEPLDLSSFPSILLIVTILRLALNVSTTRLILSNGHLGTAAAGHVVEAFGYFVIQGSVIIGAIIFSILTIINFIVITKGSGRIAEVAARFSLDAMPGKQMAIDADLSAGLIQEAEARSRRKFLENESTFYGSMDGANKFVRGDAIAGVLITFINFIAGIIIGVAQKDMTFAKALQTYTVLTVGDGLVAQIPALLVSTAAGLLVTKSGVHGPAERAIATQLGKYPQAFAVSAGLLSVMSMVPWIPFVPFTLTATVCGTISYFLYAARKTHKDGDTEAKKTKPITQEEEKRAAELALSQSLQIDSVRIELGYELLPLINSVDGQKITDQIKVLRKQIAQDMGFILPSVRIQDNLELEPRQYKLKIKEIDCGGGSVYPDKLMIMNPNGNNIDLPGEDAKEPAFGLDVKWIDKKAKEEALFKGYTVVEPSAVIITHLTEVVKENIAELLTYSETQKLIDNIQEEHKKLALDIIPSQVSLVILQRVLQALLSENVSIRDLPTILEAISEVSMAYNRNVAKLVEHVRVRLSKQICFMNTGERGYIPVLMLSPKWEQVFVENLKGDGDEKQLVMPPSQLKEFVNAVNKAIEQHDVAAEIPIILAAASLRPYIRSIIERFHPSLVVLSQNEIYPKAKIKTFGSI